MTGQEIAERLSRLRERLLDTGAKRISRAGAGHEIQAILSLLPSERTWTPHLDYTGEPMREGCFRDPPELPNCPYRELADKAISCVADAERETNWGGPTFGPTPSEELRSEYDAISGVGTL